MMVFRIRHFCSVTLALTLFAIATGRATAQGYNDFPYSIMTPESGAASHGQRMQSPHARPPKTPDAGEHLATKLARQRFVARGSSGSVLPTPLPRTQLIPPEGGSTLSLHAAPQEQGPTILPNGTAVPNLAHGPETFQDRASRCSFQQGLYGAQGGSSPQYMGACLH